MICNVIENFNETTFGQIGSLIKAKPNSDGLIN
jgi:hypothetical protein